MKNVMKAWLHKSKRLLTPGHGIAAAVVVIAVYQIWGIVFVPGGTGSNVVLGLLAAVAVIYLGATNLGPIVDNYVVPKAKREKMRALREGEDTVADVDDLLARNAKKKVKPPLTDKQTANLAEKNDAVRKAIGGDVDALRSKLAELDKSIHAALGDKKGGLAAQAKSLGIAFAVAVALRLFLVAPFQIPSGSMIPTLEIGDHLFVFRAMYGLQSPATGEPSYLARWSMPEPGDVVVFEAPPWVPKNAGEDWIKRVIAGPGQRVKRVGQTVYVDDKPYTLEGGGKMSRYMDFTEMASGGRGRWSEETALYFKERIGDATHDTYVDMPPTTADWPTPGEPRQDMKGLSCTETECTVKAGFVFVMGDNRDHSSDGRVWGAVPADNVKGKALFIWVSVNGSQESVHLGKFTLPGFRWSRLFRWID